MKIKNIVMRVPRTPSRSATEKHIALIQLRTQWRIQDFPEVEAPTLQEAPTSDFAQFSRKLHEIERIWTPLGRGARPKLYCVHLPLVHMQAVKRSADDALRI